MDFNAFSFLFNPVKRLLATLVVLGGKNASNLDIIYPYPLV